MFSVPQLTCEVWTTHPNKLQVGRASGVQTGMDPRLETLKIGTNCSERRFGWQLRRFSVCLRSYKTG
jgi:hypothetical protein